MHAEGGITRHSKTHEKKKYVIDAQTKDKWCIIVIPSQVTLLSWAEG